jgi:hypothetical protein
LSGAINNTIGKIKRGGNGFDQCFGSCVIRVKEFMQSLDSSLNISASDAANKFRLTQSKGTTSLGNERGQCNWFPGWGD